MNEYVKSFLFNLKTSNNVNQASSPNTWQKYVYFTGGSVHSPGMREWS